MVPFTVSCPSETATSVSEMFAGDAWIGWLMLRYTLSRTLLITA